MALGLTLTVLVLAAEDDADGWEMAGARIDLRWLGVKGDTTRAGVETLVVEVLITVETHLMVGAVASTGIVQGSAARGDTLRPWL